MAAGKRVERTIQLDRPRTLKLNFNTFCDAEGVVGRSVLRQDLGLSEIRAIIWAGLRHEDRKLTVEKVGELMAEAEITELVTTVAEAVSEFFDTGEASGVVES